METNKAMETNVKDVKTEERAVSTTTVMKSFGNLVNRIAKTNLLETKELEELIKLKRKATEKFIKTL